MRTLLCASLTHRCLHADSAEANENSVKLRTFGMCAMIYSYLAEYPEINTLQEALDGFCKAVKNVPIAQLQAQDRRRFMKVLKILCVLRCLLV